MNNWQDDAAPPHRSRAIAGQPDRGIAGVSISIESDGDDNESTTAENDCLLPAPTPPLSAMTSGQQLAGPGASTTINMEHLNQPLRNNSIAGTGPGTGPSNGARAGSGSILSSFLARQRSYTPVSSINSPVRGNTPMNRRLQQSRSVGGPANNLEEQPQAPATAPVISSSNVRQLGFWRVNLNEMFSLSTAPSTEALRSFIQHSNFRYQTATGATAQTAPGTAAGVAAPAAAAGVIDNSHILLSQNQHPMSLNEPEASTSASTRMSSNNIGGMGRSISLREGELQLPHDSLNTRQGLSLPGLSNSNPPAGHSDGAAVTSASNAGSPVGSPSANGNEPVNGENVADDDQNVTDLAVQLLSHFVRYLPVICILLLKFVHDHLVGILDLLLLQIVNMNMNHTLRLEVARLADKKFGPLVRITIIGLLVFFWRLFMADTPPDPFGLLVPPPKQYVRVPDADSQLRSELSDIHKYINYSGPAPTIDLGGTELKEKPITLGLMLFYIAISDLLLKLLTILLKTWITMLPASLIRLKVRARLYVLVEYISQFYRALTPMTQWFQYLVQPYTGLEVISGGLFSALYIATKVFELAERGKSLKKSIATFKRDIDSERPPTKEELDAAGTVCPICHDAYNSPVILECGHIFCDECVQTWFKREQTCPMCRAKVSDDPAWQDGGTTFFYQLY